MCFSRNRPLKIYAQCTYSQDLYSEHFGVTLEDLEGHLAQYAPNSDTIDALLSAAADIAEMFMFTPSADLARHAPTSSTHIRFPLGRPWNTSRGPVPQESLSGDDVLANTILRMRDSMLHYEFQSAIADGDIGRAMNIMSVRLANLFNPIINTDCCRLRYGRLLFAGPAKASIPMNYLSWLVISSMNTQIR